MKSFKFSELLFMSDVMNNSKGLVQDPKWSSTPGHEMRVLPNFLGLLSCRDGLGIRP